jgi:outer membrane lipoprotein SlyB
MPRNTGVSTQAPLSQVYFYPKGNQSTEQQSRDHYECYNWAMKQTGFDPSQAPMQPEQRVRVVPMPPPGHDTAAYAIAGAVLGMLFSGHRHAGEGALVGAVGGAMVGAASDASRQEQAHQIEESYAEREQNVQVDAKALKFHRAMAACLEGRGYSVK